MDSAGFLADFLRTTGPFSDPKNTLTFPNRFLVVVGSCWMVPEKWP